MENGISSLQMEEQENYNYESFVKETIEVLETVLTSWKNLNDFRFIKDLEELITSFRSGYRLRPIILLNELNNKLKNDASIPRQDLAVLHILSNLQYTQSIMVK